MKRLERLATLQCRKISKLIACSGVARWLPNVARNPRMQKNAAYGRSSMVAADLEVYLARGGEIK